MRFALITVIGLIIPGPGATYADYQGADSINVSAAVTIRFSNAEIRIIRDHYASQGSHGNRGKGKKPKGLPPGIARNLARGKPLPPGIAKQFLPGDLQRALPPVRDGYERIIVGGKIILVEIATQIVRDVLTDIVFGR